MRRRYPKVRISRRRLGMLPEAARLAQVAFILRVTRSTVGHWIKTGLRAERRSRGWQIRREDVESYLRGTHRLVG